LNDFIEKEELNKEFDCIGKANNINKSDNTILTADKKILISNIIKDDTSLWLDILNFKKVNFNRIKELINKKGIIMENKLLKDYLDELGVLMVIN